MQDAARPHSEQQTALTTLVIRVLLYNLTMKDCFSDFLGADHPVWPGNLSDGMRQEEDVLLRSCKDFVFHAVWVFCDYMLRRPVSTPTAFLVQYLYCPARPLFRSPPAPS